MSDQQESCEFYSLATGKMLGKPPRQRKRGNEATASAEERSRPDLSPPDRDEPLSSVQLKSGLTDPEARTLCDVSESTWARWHRDPRAVPVAVRRLLGLYGGDVPSIDKAWQGFVFRGNRLYARNGESITPNEIEHLKMFQQQEAHLSARIEELEFWRTRAGRNEQMRLARAFGAMDMAAYALTELYVVINDSESARVKSELAPLMGAINAVLSCEARMSRAAGVEESR